jgi:hypothetical protein
MERKYFGLFGKTFGAYLYRFLIIYGVHRCHIIISEQYLRHYQLFGFCCCTHWLKELLLQAQMPVGGFRCLYRHVIPDVDIGICSTIYICDTYLKLGSSSALNFFVFWLPVFITLILILPANFSTTALILQ